MWKKVGLVSVILAVFQITHGTVIGSGDEVNNDGSPMTVNSTNGTEECPPGWNPYRLNCFKSHVVARKHRKNWEEALDYCVSIGGNLASLHNKDEEILALTGANVHEDYWIGLNDRDQENDYLWTDGSAFDYENWQSHYGYRLPHYNNRLDCTAIRQLRAGQAGWNSRSCGSRYNWICALPKGKPLTTPTPPPPPTYCYQGNTDWIEYEGMCYYFSSMSNTGDTSWIEASEYCNRQGGELVSIHSEEEGQWLRSKVVDVEKAAWWIGLRRYRADPLYRWSDKTALDFENWANLEPNDFNGEEECASMYSQESTWNDNHCGDIYPFICKKFNHSIDAITPPPTPPIPGPCPVGWKEFKNRCYSFNGLDKGSKLNWTAARSFCRGLGGDLVTIHNMEVQVYVTSQLMFSTGGLWIGLNSVRSTSRNYKWTDGTKLDFTNWSPKGQTTYHRQTCVSTEHIKLFAGTWQKYACDNEKGWICHGRKNVLPIPTPTSTTTSSTTMPCQTGYEAYGQSCYKVSERLQTFDQAKRGCVDEGATLASILDLFEQSYITTLLYQSGQPLWIGMTRSAEINEYVWVDDMPVLYTGWGENEPSGDENNGCVQTTTNGWNNTDCDSLAWSVCKIFQGPVPSTPLHTEGHCGGELEWVPYGSHCYYFGGKNTRDYASQAQFECMQRNSNLLTIHHQHENDFIYNQISDTSGIWIGLVKGYGGFKWIDDSPIQYTNWADGEPTNTKNFGQEDCVLMSSYVGDWNDARCKTYKGFVCKKPKIVPTTQTWSDEVNTLYKTATSPAPTPAVVQNVTKTATALSQISAKNAGLGIAAIILIAEAVVVVVVGIGVGVWCVRKRSNSAMYVKRRANEEDIHTEHNFDNVLFSSSRVDFHRNDNSKEDSTVVSPF